MSEILLLNARRKPARKRRAKKKIARRAPARKARTRRAPARRKKTVARRVTAKPKGSTVAKRRRKAIKKRRAPRRNPRARRTARKITRRASGAIAGLNFRTALTNSIPNVAGMMAAKWAAKRFGQPATETDPESWNYASYLKGAAGAAAAGFLANMFRRGWGQKVLEGGMNLMVYKLVQNELIPRSEWATGQFGASNDRVPGVIEENSEGEPFILGEDYEWYPLEGADDYRMLPDGMYGEDSLVAPGPLGDAMVPVGPLGYASDDGSSFLRR